MQESERPTKQKYKKSTIISEGQEHKKPTTLYLDNEAFYQALVERKKLRLETEKNGEPPPKITNFIGKCFKQICEGLASKRHFCNYPFREELVGDAIAQCLKVVDSFDVDKGKNPFSYYTQTAYFQFLARIEEEQTNLYVKLKGMQNAVSDGTLANIQEELKNESSSHSLDNITVDNDYIDDFISKFESRRERVREKNRKARPLSEIEKFMRGDLEEEVMSEETKMITEIDPVETDSTNEEQKKDKKTMLTEVDPDSTGDALNG